MFEAVNVFAQVSNPDEPQTYADIVGIIVNLMSLLIPVLISLGLLLFVWGIITFLYNQGSEESVKVGKKRMFWGVIILFVMLSSWGIVEFFFGDFFSGPFGIPFLPEPSGTPGGAGLPDCSDVFIPPGGPSVPCI